MILVKTMLNRVISTKGAKCTMLDVKDFHLNTPMKRYKYMCIKITDMHDKIKEEYNLRKIVSEGGYVYYKIQKGM
jgi:hypothetical protein